MSKPNTRKKARRQKRLARKVVWATLTDELDALDELEEELVDYAMTVVHARDVTDVVLGIGNDLDDTTPDDVADLLAQAERFDRRISERGWEFDPEHAIHGLGVWYFAPSGFEPDDDDVEAVTRVIVSTSQTGVRSDAPEDFPQSVRVIVVGADTGIPPPLMSADRFFEQIETIEAYRANDPAPVL